MHIKSFFIALLSTWGDEEVRVAFEDVSQGVFDAGRQT